MSRLPNARSRDGRRRFGTDSLVALLVMCAPALGPWPGVWVTGGSELRAQAAPPVEFAASSAAAHASRAAVRAPIGFRTHELLVAHYQKHGREFGNIGLAEYLRRAQALRDRLPAAGLLEEIRADRVITRYDRGSGAFIAFEPDGTIKTFLRPREGETYFRRQALRRTRRR